MTTIGTRRVALGVAAALASMVILTAVMLPLRDQLSIATAALVYVVPVVVGVTMGGFAAGATSVIGGFLVYDFFFIPPYWTLKVGATQNWIALGVYAIITIPIARLVAHMMTARQHAQQTGDQLRRLLDISGQLIEDRPLGELLTTIVTALHDRYPARHITLLLPEADTLKIAATTGDLLSDDDQARIVADAGQPIGAASRSGETGRPLRLALVAAGRPVGILVIAGSDITEQQWPPLQLFANQAALAVERAQLREQVLQAKLTSEVERLAHTLVAAVSHDLRTPLASIKTASSILADQQLASAVDDATRQELAALIDAQSDRLANLVTSLLDMGRIQAGVLQPQFSPTTVAGIVQQAIESGPTRRTGETAIVELPASLPPVNADAALITRVLANLIDNAYRHTPPGTRVTISARRTDTRTVTVSVTDHGPGISPDRRDEIFGLYSRRSRDSGSGLGLAIAMTFIEAHGQRIWVDQASTGGAAFHFTLASADPAIDASHCAGVPPDEPTPTIAAGG